MEILVKVTPKRVLFDAFLTSLAAVGAILAPSQATAQEGNVAAEQICTDKQVLFQKARRMNSEVEQLYKWGRYEEATPLAEQAATLFERALGPNRRDVAIALANLAALYREQRKYKAAAARMSRALGISIMAPDSKAGDVALLLFGLAEIYLRQEMYREAEPLLEMALRISEREMIAPAIKSNLDTLFGVYAMLGKSDKAEEVLAKLLHLVEADLGGDHPRLLELLNRRAILHAEMGRFGDAEKDLSRALKIAETNAVRVSEIITTLQGLAGLYLQRKELDEAERLCRKALDIAKENLRDGSQVEADILGVFAWIHLMRDEYDEAEAVLKRVLSIRQTGMGSSHTSVAEPLVNLGAIYLLQGKYREAEESLTRALSIAESVLPPNHPNVAMRLCNLAMLFAATNDIDRALAYAERAERASDEHLATMIRRGDELQKHCFLANGSSQLDFGVTLAVRASGHARAQRLALQHILRRKGRALDAMRSTLATIRDNLDDEGRELLEEYVSVRSRYADQFLSGPQGIPQEQYRKNLTQLDQQKRYIERRLSKKSIRFAELNQSISLDGVRNALPKDSVLVEWIRYEPVDVSAHKKREERKVPARYAACLLPHGTAEPACLDLGDAETIDASALAFHRALALGLEVQALASKLDELIMAPVREKLGNVRKIYLSPDGMLHFIPFAALMYKDSTGHSHYLLEHFELIYVTSGRDLVREPRSSFEAGPVTVLGAPHYDVPGQASTHRFSPLFGVLEEVEDIFGLFAGAWLLADIDATEDAVKNVRAPLILHLATHAYFGPSDCEGRPQQMTDPLLATGLALAGANACHDGAANNGILTGEEIAGLDLYGTQLVVLSACDTGIGSLAINEDDRVVGMHEGVHGLRRALALAGAETQVVSLWKVNDRATRALMGAYYRALLQGGGRAEALRLVQLDLLRSKEWAHPHFWASFVVVGSDGPLRLPVGSVRPGALRGPRGCTCQLGPAHPAQGWAVLALAGAILVVVRSRASRAERTLTKRKALVKVSSKRVFDALLTWLAAAIVVLAPSQLDAQETRGTPVKDGRASPAERKAFLEEARRLWTEVSRLFQAGHVGKAITLAKKAVLLTENAMGPDHPDVAAALNELAVLYTAQGRYNEAEPLLKRALSIREAAPGDNQLDVSTTLNNLGLLYQRQGKYREAEPLFEQALSIREKKFGAEHPDVATGLNNLGLIYGAQGRYGDAELLFKRALSIIETTVGDKHRLMGAGLSNLAELYRTQGRYSEAEPLSNRALNITETALGAKHPDVAICLNNLAGLYQAQGKYGEAEPLFERARTVWETALGTSHPYVAQSLNNLALLYQEQGRYGEAEPLFKGALSIRQSVLGNNHPDTGISLGNLGLLYQEQGRYREAEPLLKHALSIIVALGGSHQFVSIGMSNLAGLYLKQGRYREAEPLFKDALSIMEAALGANHPHVAQSLNNLAALYREQGRYSEAEPLFSRALSIREAALGGSHPYVAQSLGNLALCFQAQGRYSEAEPLFKRALSIMETALGANHPDVARSLSHLAGLYLAIKDFARALSYAERAERASDEHLSAMMRWGSEQQKHFFMATEISEVDIGVTLALQAPSLAQAHRLALQHILRRKSRVLDAMRSNLEAIRNNLDDAGRELLEQYRSVRSQYATQYLRGPQNISFEQHRENLDRLATQKRDIEYRLSEKSFRFAELNRPVSLDDVRDALPDNSALIEWIRYAPFDVNARPGKGRWQVTRYAACILPRGAESTCVDLGDARIIDTAALKLHRALALGLETRQLARELETLIMAPVLQEIGQAKKLYVSADGMLHFVPFAALVYGDAGGHTGYLIERFELVYVTSGRDLVRKPRSGFEPGPVTVFGAPHYDVPGRADTHRFDGLFGTLQEAQDIHAMFAGALPFTGPGATEGAVKNIRAPMILHLATHAYFGATDCQGRPQPTTNPLLATGLAFAGANACDDGAGNDGILTGEEIAGLDLYGTQLVVLSACDTGIGSLAINEDDRIVGVREGVYGLRRALVLAGAETQVVSLWKVNDRATRALMGAYYRALLQGSGRAEALRQVQLDLLRSKEWAHPNFWASFVVVGSDAPLRLPVGSVRLGVLRGPRGCTCQLGPASPAQDWAVLALAGAILVIVRSRSSRAERAYRAHRSPTIS